MISLLRFFLIFTVLFLTACSKEPRPYHEQSYIFGTLVDVTVYSDNEISSRQAVGSVMQELQRLHDMLHAWQPSELSLLNEAIARGESKEVSAELAMMLKEALQFFLQSQGLFNPAIGELVQIWGFHADEFKAALPNEIQIRALVESKPQMSDLVFSLQSKQPLLLASSSQRQVKAELNGISQQIDSGRHSIEPTFDKPTVEHLTRERDSASYNHQGLLVNVVRSSNSAVQLDLGGYAKGYALDRSAVILRQQGVANALVNIGGNIIALGKHGNRPWRVGIQHPRKSGALATLDLHDGEAIGTSGDYQRYFMLGSQRYCHLIDPRTGYPARVAQAATVLTRGTHAGVFSDVASKPLFISGDVGWRAAATQMNLSEAMLIDSEGMIHITAELQKRIKFADNTFIPQVE